MARAVRSISSEGADTNELQVDAPAKEKKVVAAKSKKPVSEEDTAGSAPAEVKAPRHLLQ